MCLLVLYVCFLFLFLSLCLLSSACSCFYGPCVWIKMDVMMIVPIQTGDGQEAVLVRPIRELMTTEDLKHLNRARPSFAAEDRRNSYTRTMISTRNSNRSSLVVADNVNANSYTVCWMPSADVWVVHSNHQQLIVLSNATAWYGSTWRVHSSLSPNASIGVRSGGP